MTAVGQPGTQARLAAAAPAGATNVQVTSTSNITPGDKIRLDTGPKTENVTVASVGTSGAGGTGLTLTAPLKFDHASNLPFSDRGTGVTFSPATRFAHSSNEPVQALGSSITLDKPLDSSHAINAPVVDAAVTNAGYQGPPAPDQWFGGPALSSSAGNLPAADGCTVAAAAWEVAMAWPRGSNTVTRAPACAGCEPRFVTEIDTSALGLDGSATGVVICTPQAGTRTAPVTVAQVWR